MLFWGLCSMTHLGESPMASAWRKECKECFNDTHTHTYIKPAPVMQSGRQLIHTTIYSKLSFQPSPSSEGSLTLPQRCNPSPLLALFFLKRFHATHLLCHLSKHLVQASQAALPLPVLARTLHRALHAPELPAQTQKLAAPLLQGLAAGRDLASRRMAAEVSWTTSIASGARVQLPALSCEPLEVWGF